MRKTLYYTIFLINLFSLCLYASEKAPRKSDYDLLKRTFSTFENASNENFNRLVFELSSEQIKKSVTFKYVLKDQLGRKWFFKAGPHSSKDGAIAIYRLFQLIGLDTPEIHEKELVINGEKILGSLQRIYDMKDRPYQFSELNTYSLQYIVKNHAMAYLALNSHTHPKQFILLTSSPGPLQVMRIDNSVTWFTLGHDNLSSLYNSPLLLHSPNGGYFNFWNNFLAYDVYQQGLTKKIAPEFPDQDIYVEALRNKSISLNLEEAYSWILFVQSLPDGLYGEFFETIAKNNFQYSSNGSDTTPWFVSAEYLLNFDRKNFVPNLIKRKNAAGKEFKKFYSEMLKSKNQKLDLNKVDASAKIKETIEYLERKVEEEKKTAQSLTSLPGQPEQKAIEASLSLSTHMTFSRILTLPLVPNISLRQKVLSGIIGELEEKREKVNSQEKEGINIALTNLKELKMYIEKQNVNAQMQELVLNYHNFFEDKDYIKKYFSRSK